jgi:hypothetical protein
MCPHNEPRLGGLPLGLLLGGSQHPAAPSRNDIIHPTKAVAMHTNTRLHMQTHRDCHH